MITEDSTTQKKLDWLYKRPFCATFAALNITNHGDVPRPITMIIDKIENADLYYDSVPGLERFIQFYNDNDLEQFPACKVRLDGDDLFINIIDLKGKDEKELPMEAHRDYIDIQVPMTDSETMGWKPQVDCQQELEEYDEGKDMELYRDKSQLLFDVPVGYFVVFFPSDGHRPGIAPGRSLRKLIVKTRVQS